MIQMFVLPWDEPNVKAVIDALDCTVIDVVIMRRNEPERRLVVWYDETGGETHSQYMTEAEVDDLVNGLEQYDVGRVIRCGWWDGGR